MFRGTLHLRFESLCHGKLSLFCEVHFISIWALLGFFFIEDLLHRISNYKITITHFKSLWLSISKLLRVRLFYLDLVRQFKLCVSVQIKLRLFAIRRLVRNRKLCRFYILSYPYVWIPCYLLLFLYLIFFMLFYGFFIHLNNTSSPSILAFQVLLQTELPIVFLNQWLMVFLNFFLSFCGYFILQSHSNFC